MLSRLRIEPSHITFASLEILVMLHAYIHDAVAQSTYNVEVVYDDDDVTSINKQEGAWRIHTSHNATLPCVLNRHTSDWLDGNFFVFDRSACVNAPSYAFNKHAQITSLDQCRQISRSSSPDILLALTVIAWRAMCSRPSLLGCWLGI